jgi:transcriptional regulator with XRE-family HTH domain
VTDIAPQAERAELVLGQRVRAFREARGWTQEELARKMKDLGFTWYQSTAAKTENSARPIRVNEAAALADLFEVRIDDLVREDSNPLAGRMRALVLRRSEMLTEAKNLQQAITDLQRVVPELEALNLQIKSMNALIDALNYNDKPGIKEAMKGFVEAFGTIEADAILVESGLYDRVEWPSE